MCTSECVLHACIFSSVLMGMLTIMHACDVERGLIVVSLLNAHVLEPFACLVLFLI